MIDKSDKSIISCADGTVLVAEDNKWLGRKNIKNAYLDKIVNWPHINC